MKFAIISDIHLGEESERKGVVRKLSRHSMRFLNEFVDQMNTEIKPEFVVNLGDAINDVSHDVDVQNLKIVLDALKGLACPVFNLVGNHEQKTMSKEELAIALELESLHHSTNLGDFHIVILFSEVFAAEDSRIIGEEQKMWLAHDLLTTNKRTIVFVHHSLADQDLTGNFWFEGRPNSALIRNREEIRKILEDSGKVVAVFNGHVHWNRIDVHNGIPYFNITSIVENFRNDDTPSGSYAVVDVDDQSIVVDIRGEDSQTYRYQFETK